MKSPSIQESRQYYSTFNLLDDANDNLNEEPEATAATSFNLQNCLFQSVCIGIGVLMLIIAASVGTASVFLSTTLYHNRANDITCESTCFSQLVESIPDETNLQLLEGTTYTYDAWKEIIDSAQQTIKISQMYMTLRNANPDAKGNFGNEIYNALVRAKKERGVRITVVIQKPAFGGEGDDTQLLLDEGIAEVVPLYWATAFNGGVIHSKLIIVDDKHFYVGSANTDWRSLIQVKEMGILFKNCGCVTRDVLKIFDTHVYVAKTMNSSFTGFAGFPQNTYTTINDKNRLSVVLNDGTSKGDLFISNSPLKANAPSRTNDIDALLGTINRAKQNVDIEVMDLQWMTVFVAPPKTWWSEIDSAIRNAVLRNVQVRMLISNWNHTGTEQMLSLYSLATFSKICTLSKYKYCNGTLDIKLMHIPDPTLYPPSPYTRVNHAKFISTDSQAYISTSNWSWDYFYNTAGVSVVSTHPHIVNTLHQVFERDWNSDYTQELVAVLAERKLLL